MATKKYHVVPSSEGGWNIKTADKKQRVSHFSTKSDAVSKGRRIAKDACSGLIVHNKDGRISEVTVYKKSSGRTIKSSPITSKSALKRETIRKAIATTESKRKGIIKR